MFGEGTFTGKGLYHVDAIEAALKGRIAENAVLSHDLLEGSLARSALVTDVELVEDYPDPLFGRHVAPASLGARRLAAAGYIFNPNPACQRLSAGRCSTICAAR